MITALPTPPSRSDSTNFASRADAFLGALPTFATEANALATDVNTKSDLVTTNSELTAANTEVASAAAAIAVASSNFKGNWSSLTGALSLPASVSHNGTFWTLTSNVADVTAHTPGVSSVWLKSVSEPNAVGDTKKSYASLGSDWLLMDGAEVSKTTYASLFALIGNNDCAVQPIEDFNQTSRGVVGNGSGTFILVFADYVYTSTDNGITWNKSLVARNLCSSGNPPRFQGGYFTVPSVGGFWYSTNGTTWDFNDTMFVQGSNTTCDLVFGAGVWVLSRNGQVYSSTSIAGAFTARTASNYGSGTKCYFLGTTFVLIGSHVSGGIWTSTDGTTWTQRSGISSEQVTGVYYNGSNLYVATTNIDGKVYTSPDLVTWTSRTITNYVQNSNQSCVFFNSAWYLTSGQNDGFSALWRSTDGTTWTNISNTTRFGSSVRECQLFASGTRLVACHGNTVSSTTDGTTWTHSTLESASSVGTFSNNTFVLFNHRLFTSTNGTTWTHRLGGLILPTTKGNITYPSIFSDGTTFAVASDYYNTVLYTTDGINWSNALYGISQNARTVYDVTKISSVWLMCSSGGIFSSTDLATWTASTVTTQIQAFAKSATTVVAMGGGSTSYFYSTNGTSWTTSGSTMPSNFSALLFSSDLGGFYFRLASGAQFVKESAIGTTGYSVNNETGSLYLTENGRIYILNSTSNPAYLITKSGTITVNDLGSAVNSVAFGNGVYVASGNFTWTGSSPYGGGSFLKYSTDGVNFIDVDITHLPRTFGSAGRVTFCNGVFWCSATSSTSTYLGRSTNGKEWIFTKYNGGFVSMIVPHGSNNLFVGSGLTGAFDSTKFKLPVNLSSVEPTYIKAV
ncbi:MAG: hypothetical protein ACOVOV_16095 [Dolichospermum sp.]